jgi:hypothetical protein
VRFRPLKYLKISSNASGHRTIAKRASHYFKKASIPLKMYLKSLAIFEKASISLKKSSKIIEIFIKASHLLSRKPPFLWKCLQKASLCLPNPHII